MIKNIELSIVIPVFNEEKSLNELFAQLKSSFRKINKKTEMMFVDVDR